MVLQNRAFHGHRSLRLRTVPHAPECADLVCHTDSMPSIDEGAKAYEMGLAARFGFAVKTRRTTLKLSASELARRTADLGYPISRSAIAKIESNSRSGKVDVAELLVLSAALDIPPVVLLFLIVPVGGPTEMLPGVGVLAEEAVRWMSGRVSFPRHLLADSEDKPKPPNDGVKLVGAAMSLEEALEARIPLINQLEKAPDPREVEVAQGMLRINDEQISALLEEMNDAQLALWGSRIAYEVTIDPGPPIRYQVRMDTESLPPAYSSAEKA
jgi:transcriptional regulator with XRE-family HTH domain